MGFAGLVFRATVPLQFWAKMCPPSWLALGGLCPGRREPAGSCWPKCPVASGASRGADTWACLPRACFLVLSTPTRFRWVMASEAQVPPLACPKQGPSESMTLTSLKFPCHAGGLWETLPPPPENHLRCYLLLFALLTLFMVFCNQKKIRKCPAWDFGFQQSDRGS